LKIKKCLEYAKLKKNNGISLPENCLFCCFHNFYFKILKHVSKDAEFYGESSGAFETSAVVLLKTILWVFSVFDCRSWTIEWVLVISIYRRQNDLIRKANGAVL